MRRHGYRGVIVAGPLAWAIVFTGLAKAAPSSPPGDPAVVQSLSACGGLADKARLACYDRAMAAARGPGGDVVVIDRERSQAIRRRTFGLNLPTVSLSGHVAKEQPVTHLVVELANAQQTNDGSWMMTTRDGAVWLQVNDDRPYRPPHSGSTVAIKHALFGAYFCTVDGQPAIRCTRER